MLEYGVGLLWQRANVMLGAITYTELGAIAGLVLLRQRIRAVSAWSTAAIDFLRLSWLLAHPALFECTFYLFIYFP